MNLSIRKADISELKIVCALGITTFYEAYFEQDNPRDLADYVLENFSPEQIERELKKADSTFFIAELNGKAVGYAKLRENSEADCLKGIKAVELQRIYVLEKVKGKGVGAALLRHCLAAARAKNYRTIWLGVWENNPAAQRFYEKFGFVRAGKLRFVYGENLETNYVFKLDLG